MQFRYDPTGRFEVLKSQRAQFVSQILGDFKSTCSSAASRPIADPGPAIASMRGRPNDATHGPDPAVGEDHAGSGGEVRSPVADHQLPPLCLPPRSMIRLRAAGWPIFLEGGSATPGCGCAVPRA